jgi:hypothetical protein
MSAVQVKIISDGSPYGVQVIDARTDEVIKHLRAVKWEARAGELPVAHLEVALTEVYAECGDAFVWIGRYKIRLDQWQQLEQMIERLVSERD